MRNFKNNDAILCSTQEQWDKVLEHYHSTSPTYIGDFFERNNDGRGILFFPFCKSWSSNSSPDIKEYKYKVFPFNKIFSNEEPIYEIY